MKGCYDVSCLLKFVLHLRLFLGEWIYTAAKRNWRVSSHEWCLQRPVCVSCAVCVFACACVWLTKWVGVHISFGRCCRMCEFVLCSCLQTNNWSCVSEKSTTLVCSDSSAVKLVQLVQWQTLIVQQNVNVDANHFPQTGVALLPATKLSVWKFDDNVQRLVMHSSSKRLMKYLYWSIEIFIVNHFTRKKKKHWPERKFDFKSIFLSKLEYINK